MKIKIVDFLDGTVSVCCASHPLKSSLSLGFCVLESEEEIAETILWIG